MVGDSGEIISSHPFDDQPHFFGGPKWTITSTTKFHKWWLWDDYCWMVMVLDRKTPDLKLCARTQTCSCKTILGALYSELVELFGFWFGRTKAPYEQNYPCECPDLGQWKLAVTWVILGAKKSPRFFSAHVTWFPTKKGTRLNRCFRTSRNHQFMLWFFRWFVDTWFVDLVGLVCHPHHPGRPVEACWFNPIPQIGPRLR